MTFSKSDITRQRLYNHGLSKVMFESPKDIVAHFGAVQAQDYAGAKWALGQRLKDATEASIEQAFTDGSILRLHVLRPTWHFVAPEDIRWMLKLTAPRVHAASAYMIRNQGIDSQVIKRSQTIFEKALRDNQYLTRDELVSALKQDGIDSDNNLRFTYLVMIAELEGLLCSGPRRGKQFTYALLEDRVPPAKKLMHEESLAELARRYFTSHGPATLKDFSWWSGLTMTDAKHGIEMVKSQLESEEMDGQTYLFKEIDHLPKIKSPNVFLLPDYDEYGVGYTNRSLIYDESNNKKLDARGMFLAQYIVVIDGQIAGTWKRTLKKKLVEIELDPFKKLTGVEHQAVVKAAEKYGKFLGLSTEVSWKS